MKIIHMQSLKDLTSIHPEQKKTQKKQLTADIQKKKKIQKDTKG